MLFEQAIAIERRGWRSISMRAVGRVDQRGPAYGRLRIRFAVVWRLHHVSTRLCLCVRCRVAIAGAFARCQRPDEIGASPVAVAYRDLQAFASESGAFSPRGEDF